MNAIEARNLRYRYPDGNPALNGVDFFIGEGETVGFVGPNGAGKTTLLLGLCGLLETEGVIKIFGKNLTKENAKDIRCDMGLLFQNPDDQLFMPTVYEDVAFGPKNLGCDKKKLPEIVRKSLAAVGLDGFQDRASHHLSFGEKKRISLATVIAMEPKILMFDEPTSSLDPGSRKEFIKLMQSISSTKIIAGHDLDMIGKLCSRVMLLNCGKIVAEGAADEILGNQKLLEENGL